MGRRTSPCTKCGEDMLMGTKCLSCEELSVK